MTEFESRLVAALEAEVQETAMSVETDRGAEELNSRMDAADRSRRRRGLLSVAAGVVALGVVAAVITATMPANEASPPIGSVSPTPTPRPIAVTSRTFGDPLTFTLPGWAAGLEPDQEAKGYWSWARCSTPDDCIGLSFNRFAAVYRPGSSRPEAITGYDGYLAYLDSLPASLVTVSGRSTTTIGGLPATVLTVATTRDLPGALGCFTGFTNKEATDCWPFAKRVMLLVRAGNAAVLPTRLAVIDTGDAVPLVIMSTTFRENPDGAAWLAQLDEMLPTITFRAAPSP